MYRVFAGLSVALLVVLAVVIFNDYNREWKGLQKKFYRMELEKAKDEREREFVKSRKVEIKQVSLDGFKRVDRCMTCHLGAEDSRFAEAGEPFKTHPNPDQHPFAKFGCAVCHGGDGRATTAKRAHGNPQDWEIQAELAPMLPIKYIQASCSKCHVDEELPGMPRLTLGKKLFDDKGCFNCHKVNGVGKRNIGPDLSHEGVYDRAGYRSPDWIFRHFKDPALLAPDTEMPNFRLSDDEANALTLLMLSYTGEEISGYLSSRKAGEAKQVAIRDYKAGLKRPEPSGGAGLYTEIRCAACHKIKGKGGIVAASLTDVGNRRMELWLIEHFKSPRGVVPYSLMPDFRLSEEEVEELTEYMLTLRTGGEKVIALKAAEEGEVEKGSVPGEDVYRRKECALCHSLNGAGMPVGPDLSNIGDRRDAAWLSRYFKNGPKAVYSKSMMPKIEFSPEDAQILAQYLTTLKD